LMQQRGVTQALNLDGGNTMALIFRGRMLNKLAVYKNKKFIRSVTSMIGIGYTQEMAD
ncbi:MAG: phosphodiester glycosidase family protein, partial [Clostridia bacterium]|nr:phosphodiester glycosidase family protein [Clostridia bacterium]